MSLDWELSRGEGIEFWEEPEVGQVFADYDGKMIQINAAMGAVSSQARGSLKTPFKALLRTLTNRVPYLIASDIQLEVRWWVGLQERYESDGTADVDNILKPIIDALTGPEGVMVNDCQIQSATSYWVTRQASRSIDIKLWSFGGFLYEKSSLIFVEVARNLYGCTSAFDSGG